MKRTLLAVTAVLTLAACSDQPATTPEATRDCPSGMASCSQLGPPVTRYCPTDRGACEGHPVRPEDISSSMFAGARVSVTVPR